MSCCVLVHLLITVISCHVRELFLDANPLFSLFPSGKFEPHRIKLHPAELEEHGSFSSRQETRPQGRRQASHDEWKVTISNQFRHDSELNQFLFLIFCKVSSRIFQTLLFFSLNCLQMTLTKRYYLLQAILANHTKETSAFITFNNMFLTHFKIQIIYVSNPVLLLDYCNKNSPFQRTKGSKQQCFGGNLWWIPPLI